MIKVQILVHPSTNEIHSLNISGHALSGEHGKDLVCAGVSAVVFGGLQSLQDNDAFKIVVSEGNVTLTCIKDVINHDKIVLETLITGLKLIENSYSKYIKISTRKEGIIK